MESAVRAHRLAQIATRARLDALLEQLGGALAVLVREALGGPAHGHRLEREAHLEEVAQLLHVDRDDLGAVMGHVLGEPERLQLPDGLADGRDAHAERGRQILEP